MLFRLILLLTIVPFVELILLVRLAELTSLSFTLVVVLVTGIVGATLARYQGWTTLLRIRRQLSDGHFPTDSLQDGAMILFAGALLLTPGLLTDAVGFALLVPPVRRVIKRLIARRLRSSFRVQTYRDSWEAHEAASHWRDERTLDGDHKVIDVRVVDAPDEDRDRPADDSSLRGK